jgi:hypothetical protein
VAEYWIGFATCATGVCSGQGRVAQLGEHLLCKQGDSAGAQENRAFRHVCFAPEADLRR